MALFSNIPHFGYELLIYEIAKALNVKTLILTQAPAYPGKLFYMESTEEYGDFSFMDEREDCDYQTLERKYDEKVFCMEGVKEFRFSLVNAIFRSLIRTPHRFCSEFLPHCRRYQKVKKYKKNLSKMIRSVDYSRKYVYFPLHLQPELTTSALGGVFNDQVLALEILAKMIPDDWIIYAKENPKQTEFMRGHGFFERIKRIDGLRMVPLNENTFKLIEHAQFVATITGTAGWEAIRGGKPALVFGRTWYQNFEGVFKWHPHIDVADIINYSVDHSKLEKDYNALRAMCADGIIDNDYTCLIEDYDEMKNAQTLTELLTRLIRKVNQNNTLAYVTKKAA